MVWSMKCSISWKVRHFVNKYAQKLRSSLVLYAIYFWFSIFFLYFLVDANEIGFFFWKSVFIEKLNNTDAIKDENDEEEIPMLLYNIFNGFSHYI